MSMYEITGVISDVARELMSSPFPEVRAAFRKYAKASEEERRNYLLLLDRNDKHILIDEREYDIQWDGDDVVSITPKKNAIHATLMMA